MKNKAKIIGSGSYLPPNKISNQMLVEKLAKNNIETSDEWITSRSGIKNRYYVTNETTSDMASKAAFHALKMANLGANDIDLIIVATTTPDYIFPSTACIIQKKLNITNNCPCFDVQAVCSGFIYALTIAAQFIENGTYKNILVIGAESFSNLLNFNDRSTCVLFGDGAGAIILSQSNNETGIIASTLHSNSQDIDILCAKTYIKQGQMVGDGFMCMDGQAVFKLAVNSLEQVAIECLAKAKMSAQNLDWLIPHQANIRIMQSVAKKLGMTEDKMIATVSEHGNTSAASVPLALDYAIRNNKIKVNDNVMLQGVGAGFSWGAVIFKY